MPIYEYVCKSCGRKTEVIARFGDPPLKICPHCGGKLKKAASAPAIQFKGTGWYVTDYARARKEDKTEKAPEKEGASGEKTAEKESASGEKAPEKESASGEKPAEKKKEAGEKKASKKE
jgi:putative FmdB family regulatory protein